MALHITLFRKPQRARLWELSFRSRYVLMSVVFTRLSGIALN